MSSTKEEIVFSETYGEPIRLIGFESIDQFVHMIEWLGRGTDFRKFVADDIESKVCGQSPGAKVIEIRSTKLPLANTVVEPHAAGEPALLKRFTITFYLHLLVRTANGDPWQLEIHQTYEADAALMRSPKPQIRMDFTVVSHRRLPA